MSLRESAISALTRFPPRDVVPRILAVAEDADPAPAIQALRTILRRDLGDDLDAWRAWWRAQS